MKELTLTHLPGECFFCLLFLSCCFSRQLVEMEAITCILWDTWQCNPLKESTISLVCTHRCTWLTRESLTSLPHREHFDSRFRSKAAAPALYFALYCSVPSLSYVLFLLGHLFAGHQKKTLTAGLIASFCFPTLSRYLVKEEYINCITVF